MGLLRAPLLLKMTGETPEVRFDKRKPKMATMAAMAEVAAMAAKWAVLLLLDIQWHTITKRAPVGAKKV